VCCDQKVNNALAVWNPKTRWWFQTCLFSPLLGEMIQFDLYLSTRLKPPTRKQPCLWCWFVRQRWSCFGCRTVALDVAHVSTDLLIRAKTLWKNRKIQSWYSKHVFFGCFSWMVPNLCILGKRLFQKFHPFKTGCLGFQDVVEHLHHNWWSTKGMF